jgi:hypothetical protein
VRPILESLGADGLIEQLRRHSITLWTLTSRGRRRLSALQRTGRASLPESPQHRGWVEARAAASERIEVLRKTLRIELRDAVSLLDADAADSDAWFMAGDRLGLACAHLASATHCLCEWPEPDDARADIDTRIQGTGAAT